jgi:hypothetical protein
MNLQWTTDYIFRRSKRTTTAHANDGGNFYTVLNVIRSTIVDSFTTMSNESIVEFATKSND